MTDELTVALIHQAVWERFEGVVPMKGDEVDLTVVVLAVLHELEERNIIEVEVTV